MDKTEDFLHYKVLYTTVQSAQTLYTVVLLLSRDFIQTDTAVGSYEYRVTDIEVVLIQTRHRFMEIYKLENRRKIPVIMNETIYKFILAEQTLNYQAEQI